MQAFLTTNTNTSQTYLTTYNWDATYNQSNIQETLLAEMLARREKGLCYNCDERFGPGHRCKKQQIFILETMEEALIRCGFGYSAEISIICQSF